MVTLRCNINPTTRWPIARVAVLIVFVSLLPCCEEVGTDTLQSSTPAGELVDSSGCKWRSTLLDRLTPQQVADCIEYRYSADGRLHLDHLNTAFNCCPEFTATVRVTGTSIYITEREITGECDCLCLFDLKYAVSELPLGEYRVIVNQEYLHVDDEPLDFLIDLSASTSGIHCVERDHYPWN